jgi:hypothetical protein
MSQGEIQHYSHKMSEMTHKGKVSYIIYGIRHMMREGISMNISYQMTFLQTYSVVISLSIFCKFPKLMAIHYCVLMLP